MDRLDPYLLALWDALVEPLGWALVGWFVLAILIAATLGDERK